MARLSADKIMGALVRARVITAEELHYVTHVDIRIDSIGAKVTVHKIGNVTVERFLDELGDGNNG